MGAHAAVELSAPAPEVSGLLRRWGRWVLGAAQVVVGAAVWLVALSFGVVVPGVGFAVLGALLALEGRLARGESVRPVLEAAPRVGAVAAIAWLAALPARLLWAATLDARVIAPTGAAPRVLLVLTVAAATLAVVHLSLAVARGAGLSALLWPPSNLRWLRAALRDWLGSVSTRAERDARAKAARSTLSRSHAPAARGAGARSDAVGGGQPDSDTAAELGSSDGQAEARVAGAPRSAADAHAELGVLTDAQVDERPGAAARSCAGWQRDAGGAGLLATAPGSAIEAVRPGAPADAGVRSRSALERRATQVKALLRTVLLAARAGLVACLAALAWLLVPSLLWLAARGTDADTPRPGLVLLGGAVLVPVLAVLPWLQAAYAASGDWKDLFRWRAVRQRFRRAPLAWALALLLTCALTTPLYVLKVALPPRDAGWLVALLFVVTVVPVRCALALAWRRAGRPEAPVHGLWVWSARLLILAVLLATSLALYLAPIVDVHGRWALLAHHAFLLPSPF